MTLKRYLSILMLTIYLLFVGMPVYASLACHCVRMSEEHAHSCHTHGLSSETDLESHYSAPPCCDDDHAGQTTLYIPSPDYKDACRCWAADAVAPVDFSAGLRAPLPCVAWCYGRLHTCLCTGAVAGIGVRGPPQI